MKIILPILLLAILAQAAVITIQSNTDRIHRGRVMKVKTMDGEMQVVFNGEQFLEVARHSTNSAIHPSTNLDNLLPLMRSDFWENACKAAQKLADEAVVECQKCQKMFIAHLEGDKEVKYYEAAFRAIRFGDNALFQIVPDPDWQTDPDCPATGLIVACSSGAVLPKILKITMPCGYCWQLNWGEQAPSQSVQCPCGNPDHLVICLESIP